MGQNPNIHKPVKDIAISILTIFIQKVTNSFVIPSPLLVLQRKTRGGNVRFSCKYPHWLQPGGSKQKSDANSSVAFLFAYLL